MKFCAGILDFARNSIFCQGILDLILGILEFLSKIYALKCKLREREIKIFRAFCSFLPIL